MATTGSTKSSSSRRISQRWASLFVNYSVVHKSRNVTCYFSYSSVKVTQVTVIPSLVILICKCILAHRNCIKCWIGAAMVVGYSSGQKAWCAATADQLKFYTGSTMWRATTMVTKQKSNANLGSLSHKR